MGDRSASVQVNSNVTITVLNKNNEPIQIVKKHNKATVLMVEGLLHFLQGWYSSTEFNKDLGGGTPEDSLIYIPTKLGFGNIGVKTQVEAAHGNVPMFNSVNSGDFVEPTFGSVRLQSPLLKWRGTIDEVEYQQFSDSEITSYEDLNNSESLRLITKISPRQLVGEYSYGEQEGSSFFPYERSFYDPEKQQYCSMITEIGLFSSKDTLLARVLLDAPVERIPVNDDSGIIGYTYKFEDPDNPSNPIVQAEDTTVVVEWRIGLISISDKDQFVTQNNIKYSDLSNQLSIQIADQLSEDIVPTSDEIEEMIQNILSGYDDISNTN